MTRIASGKRERPILFSAPMVRAILDGRKTQTRRLVDLAHRDQPEFYDSIDFVDGDWRAHFAHCCSPIRCPYGEPGDLLWVRETWCQAWTDDGPEDPPRALYAADGVEVIKIGDDGGYAYRKNGLAASPWRPSIHMPRWASRITLEVTGVRVERLQDISNADAYAEGVLHTEPKLVHGHLASMSASESFAVLWDQINAKRAPFSSNPWVWVISFRRVQP